MIYLILKNIQMAKIDIVWMGMVNKFKKTIKHRLHSKKYFTNSVQCLQHYYHIHIFWYFILRFPYLTGTPFG